MERGSKGHLDESLNLRSFYLRLLRKIWIIPVAAFVGALLPIQPLLTLTPLVLLEVELLETHCLNLISPITIM